MKLEEIVALGVEQAAAEAIFGRFEEIKESFGLEIQKMNRDREIEDILRRSGARNIKAVRALIDEGEDIESQVEKLMRENDTKFLFESAKKGFEPARSGEKLPDVKKDDFEARLLDARKRKDTVEAIRIKQQAASEGIMLL